MHFFCCVFCLRGIKLGQETIINLNNYIMNKKEKLEQVNHLVQKLGLSPQEAVEYFSAKVVESSSVVRECEVAVGVLPGMYVYADGLISSEIIEGRRVMAVVGSVDGSDVLAVCLHEACLPWSSDWLEAKATQEMTGGKEATRKLLEISRKKRQEAEAAQWCYDYAEDGVIQGEAFLPSLTELEKLFANKAAINVSLKALGAALFERWYWSSTEGTNTSAWKFSMNYGYRNGNFKSNSNNYARSVIAFEF